MTYIIVDTSHRGKQWVKSMLEPDENFELLSSPNQIRGRAFYRQDDLYILTKKTEIWEVLFPALCGCRIFCHEQWVVKK